MVATPATLAAASPQVRTGLVTVRVVGISRTSSLERVDALLRNSFDGLTVETFGRRVQIPPGTYFVGAAIPTIRSGSEVSETLTVRLVTIRRSKTIELSSAGGRLLRVSVTGGVSQTGLTALACLGLKRFGTEEPVATSAGPGEAIYVTPLTARQVTFSYASQWVGAQGTTYQLVGSTRGRLPARPIFHVPSSALARVRVEIRSAAEPFDSADLTVQPGGPNEPCGGDLVFSFPSPAQPQVMAVYRTAGVWTTELLTSRGPRKNGFFYRTRKYRPGQSYLDLVGSAVVGPAANFPQISGPFFGLIIDSFFSDPIFTGTECCSRTTATLAIRGRVIRRWRGTDTGPGSPAFSGRVFTRSAWYDLTVASRRYNPIVPLPAGIPSPRMTLVWRFHVTPTPPTGNARSIPVTLTTFRPAGLDLANAAPASGTTPLRLTVVRAGDPASPAPRYRLTSVRLMVSSNDGQTWQPVPVSAHHGFWLAQVPDPASGFVSLRSIVTDARGNSTIETIYRAYAVG